MLNNSSLQLEDDYQAAELPVCYPGLEGCRNVEEFSCEKKIEEGTYGVVYRATDKTTGETVALKKLKMEKERDGFPITSIREINMLLKCEKHPNIVNLKEVVVGSTLDQIYLVMEFVEQDMKSLMETMRQKNRSFSIGVQKSLMKQLLSGLKHMHGLWVIHRDLKTSNLLLSSRGVLKIADFGLAREFGDPLKPYTPVVVTLAYRAPELLLGEKIYSTAIDMWSVGCIMAELILQKPLFPGESEQSQIEKIFMALGSPNEKIWPGFGVLPVVKSVSLPQFAYNRLRETLPSTKLAEAGFRLLNALLRYNVSKRISAEDALQHEWFMEQPTTTESKILPGNSKEVEERSEGFILK